MPPLLRSLRLPPWLAPRLRRSASSHSSHGTHPAPANESFGTSFYLILAGLPTAYIIYAFSRDDKGSSWVAKLTELYSAPHQTWVERNALHTRMVEQAGMDRNLFVRTVDNGVWPELKMPESISGGSPYNVPAGHYANLDKLVTYYKDKHNKEEEEKHALMREGRLPAQLREKEAREKADAEAALAAAAKAAKKAVGKGS